MSRFLAVVDRRGTLDLAGAVRAAREALTRGGSRERAFELVRPPFAALALTHGDDPPLVAEGGSVRLTGGFGPADGRAAEFLARCERALAAREGAPPLPEGPWGRRCLVAWSAASGALLLAAEPNALEPAYWFDGDGLTVVASELKAIWALCRASLTPDADALLELYAVGQCLGARTPFREVAFAEPGMLYSFREQGVTRQEYYRPAFGESAPSAREDGIGGLNAALLDVLRACRPVANRVTVALTGGMDSRYVLAGACRTWPEVESLTFGEPRATDVVMAARLARRAGVPHYPYPVDERFLADWAPLAVWRMDGQVNALTANGMDAVVAHAPRSTWFLNGVCGDALMGTFLHPSHLRLAGDPDLAAAVVLRARRFHRREPAAIFKPELLARATAAPSETLRAIMARYRYERLGNVMLSYWLRHYLPRTSAMGLVLETPFVVHLGPLADPEFVRAASIFPLELRITGRAYRRALRRLAPELLAVPWGRTGMPAGWSWPLHALGRLGMHYGVLPRPRPAADFARQLRGPLAPWIRGLLLAPATLEDGYFLPGYLRSIVERHAGGVADHATELGMAATVELWRRLFVEGRVELAAPPPAAG
jgi:asparagine synthetase B (glutamine-hydrolysing)